MLHPRTLGLTLCALVAFAANSVLCRLALGDGAIDPASFSAIRLVAGAVTLLAISRASVTGAPRGVGGDWSSAGLLMLYAVPFSFAYVTLTTGTGALILFGAVQGTMLVSALLSGERPAWVEWVGWALALGGLVYLVSPGLSAPPAGSSLLMVVAGCAWGGYSLRGRHVRAALVATTGNFVRTVPFALLLPLAMWGGAHVSPTGVMLAVLSGGLASGVGYAVWYAALGGLTSTHAATVQLSVPILAALGGVVFVSEPLTLRLVLSALLILGGIGLAVVGSPAVESSQRSS